MQNQLYTYFLRMPLSIRILCIALTSVFSFGIIVYYLEPNTFPTMFDGIWWAIITASTVGYGDFVPKTVLGKVAGILLILTGAGFLSTYLVTLSAVAVTKQNAYMEGKMYFKGKQHIVVIGWNERSRELLNSLSTQIDDYMITLIDETLQRNPLPIKKVHFIQGRPSLDEVLLKANILEAQKVIITSDQSKDELQADMNTIITLLAIKGIHPTVPCIVEILKADQVANAKRAGADEVIQTNNLISFIMQNSLSSQEMVTSFLDLLNHTTDNTIIYTKYEQHYIGKDFASLSSTLITERKLLLGVKRANNTFINPAPTFVIEQGDELILIVH